MALDPWAWAALGLAAVVIGISKTALPGGSILAIALFAAVLPARTSTAATLLLLMVGDVFADERVELASKARVQGNIHYQVVEMSAGAQLTGRLIHAALGASDDGSAQPAS